MSTGIVSDATATSLSEMVSTSISVEVDSTVLGLDSTCVAALSGIFISPSAFRCVSSDITIFGSASVGVVVEVQHVSLLSMEQS